MNDKELKYFLKAKVLPYYIASHKLIEYTRDLKHSKDSLRMMHMDSGICYFAHRSHKKSIAGQPLILKYSDGYIKKYWTDPPIDCGTMDELIQSLQIRIDIMQKIIES